MEEELSEKVALMNVFDIDELPVPDTPPPPTIKALHVETNIAHRYARTRITTQMVNPATIWFQEINFCVILPETAFISEFLLELDGVVHKAFVKEKKVPKNIKKKPVSSSKVTLFVRDSNRFTFSLYADPQQEVTFKLTYEELLTRTSGLYKHKLNLNPGQIVDDLSVKINISESSPICRIEVPSLRESNEIEGSSENTTQDALARIKLVSPKNIIIHWEPTPDEQKKLRMNGIKGQLQVLYDVERSPEGEILVNDGYFLHFYAAEDLPPLSKHVVFVLDMSMSMTGRKIEQMKNGLETILEELHDKDYFSILIFHTAVYIWNSKVLIQENIEEISNTIIRANPENIAKAKELIKTLETPGCTNMNSALMRSLDVAQLGSSVKAEAGRVPEKMIIFLTDGLPNVEESDPNNIINNVTNKNNENSDKARIYTLGFGNNADMDFLKKLAVKNRGFAKKIYEASDAARQLRDFYRQISSPLLSDIIFHYNPEKLRTKTLTRIKFRTFFLGSEIVVAGQLEGNHKSDDLPGSIYARGEDGQQTIIDVPGITKGTSEHGITERAWAYLSIQQLLEKERAGFTKNKKKILDLALRYSFVTPVTSLVVVKPYESKLVEVEDASKPVASDGGSPPIAFISSPNSVHPQAISSGIVRVPASVGSACSLRSTPSLGSPLSFPSTHFPSAPIVASQGAPPPIAYISSSSSVCPRAVSGTARPLHALPSFDSAFSLRPSPSYGSPLSFPSPHFASAPIVASQGPPPPIAYISSSSSVCPRAFSGTARPLHALPSFNSAFSLRPSPSYGSPLSFPSPHFASAPIVASQGPPPPIAYISSSSPVCPRVSGTARPLHALPSFDSAFSLRPSPSFGSPHSFPFPHYASAPIVASQGAPLPIAYISSSSSGCPRAVSGTARPLHALPSFNSAFSLRTTPSFGSPLSFPSPHFASAPIVTSHGAPPPLPYIPLHSISSRPFPAPARPLSAPPSLGPSSTFVTPHGHSPNYPSPLSFAPSPNYASPATYGSSSSSGVPLPLLLKSQGKNKTTDIQSTEKKEDNLSYPVPRFNLDDFKKCFRMEKQTMELLLGAIGKHSNANLERKSDIPLEKKVLFTIWVLSNSETFLSLSERLEMDLNTAHSCVKEILLILNKMIEEYIQWPSYFQCTETARIFKERSRGISNVIGVIDATHIFIKEPDENKLLYFNRYQSYSFKLQAVCDASNKFININVGHPGSYDDAKIFRKSAIYQKEFISPYFMIGDCGYPLLKELITPFNDRVPLTPEQKVFNFRLKTIRSTIDRAFGMLKGKWGRLYFIDLSDLKYIKDIIAGCCVLHNFILINEKMSEDNKLIDFNPFINIPNIESHESERHDEGEARRNRIMSGLN